MLVSAGKHERMSHKIAREFGKHPGSQQDVYSKPWGRSGLQTDLRVVEEHQTDVSHLNQILWLSESSMSEVVVGGGRSVRRPDHPQT